MEIYATELMGAEAYDVQGNFVGRVREFFVEPAQATNRLSHFLLSRGRFQPLMARYDQVATVAPGTMRLKRQRARSATLRTERVASGGPQGFARSADHRYARPQGRARE